MRVSLLMLCLLATLLCVFGAVSHWNPMGKGTFRNLYGFNNAIALSGHCVIDAQTVLSEGQVITRNNCEQITCHSDGYATFATCGVKGGPKPCELGEKKYPFAEYPKCCINVLYCPHGVSEI